MALYKDGNPVSGLNSIPRLTLAQYNALNVKPEFWVRTDAPESYKKLSADQVSYDSNNTVKDKIDDLNKAVSNSDTYSFPKSASEVSGGNDTYTVLHKGTAFISYTFADYTYSQFSLLLNGVYIPDGMISSGSKNLEGLKNVISFPVNVGDRIQVSFYSTYGVSAIKLRVLY